MIAAMMSLVLALQSDELAEAAKKTSALENYSFKNESKVGTKAKNQPGAMEGHYQKDQPISLKSGSAECFKKGGLVVYKDGDDWKLLEKAQKGEKKKQPATVFAAVKFPHEEIENFDKNFEKVEKAAEKDRDCTVWSGTLTPSAARSLVSTGSKAEGKSQASYTGSAKVWVNDKGLIIRYEISAHVKGENKKGPFESDITRSVEITEGGPAVEIPEAAKKLLDGQS